MAVLFRGRVSAGALLIGSVVLDVQPFAVLFLGMPFALHGLSHTFAVSALVALALALAMQLLLKQSLSNLFLGALLGTWSHVFLDSFLYEDMAPFFPFEGNPLLYALTPGQVYLLCTLAFPLVGVLFYYNKDRE
jgi:membrane-bound metal-dependent hydrolase YbcI (DUF457 family)